MNKFNANSIPRPYIFFAVFSALVISAVIFICSTSFAAEKPLLIQNNWPSAIKSNVENDTDQVITVRGMGYASAEAVELGDINYCKIMAADAAKAEAYAALVEKVDGIQIDAKSTVVNHRTTSRSVETKISGLINNADVIFEEYSENGMACIITLQLKLTNKNNPSESLAAAIMPQDYVKEEFPKPTNDNIISTAALPAQNTYTGVIIDCSGLGLKTAMSPVIKDDNGRKLYGYKNLNPTYICKYGMAGYTTSNENNIARAGTNPLVIKAIALENFVNPIIPISQGELMLIANQKTHFLDNCAVVFIK